MMTCQAGLSSLRGALSPHGITSNEHSPVDFNITKNEETGDITIRKTLTGIRDALYSRNGGTVRLSLDALVEGQFPQGSNVDPQLRVSMSTLAHALGSTYRYDLAAVVNEALGIEAPPMPDGEAGLSSVAEKPFREIVSLLEDYALEFQNATQAARAQLNP